MMETQFAMHLDATRPELRPVCDDPGERAVAAALRWGKDQARQVADISALTGITGREVQRIIQHLILEHSWPIGSRSQEPYGNYLIDSAAELEHAVQLLRSRGLSELTRAAALKRMSLEDYLRSIQPELALRRN